MKDEIEKQKIADILYSHVKQMMGMAYISQNDIPDIASELALLSQSQPKAEKGKPNKTGREREFDGLMGENGNDNPKAEVKDCGNCRDLDDDNSYDCKKCDEGFSNWHPVKAIDLKCICNMDQSNYKDCPIHGTPMEITIGIK